MSTIDHKKNKTFSRIWLDGVPVTAGDFDSAPFWSPDGAHLGFTSRRSENKGEATLHVLPVAVGGETRTVCVMPDGIEAPAWSPDGNWIAFTSRTRHERYEAEDASFQAPRKVERFVGRLNGEDWIFDRPSDVYVVPALGIGAPKNLTPDEFQHAGISWLPDSSAVATSAQRHDSWDRDWAEDIYVVPLNGDIRRVTAGDGRFTNPSVSPDGSRIAFIGATDNRTYPMNDQVLVASLDRSEQPVSDLVVASTGLDRTFACTIGTQDPQWISDSELLATAEDRGDTHAYRVTADGSEPPVAVTSGPITVTGLSASAGTVATTQTTVNRLSELFVGDQQMSSVSDAISERLLEWEKFVVPTADGTDEIDAWIMRPAEFDEASTYPVLLNVHGGPFTQYGEYFFDEAQMQAAAGFVVLMSNPRGGSGRHSEWGQALLGPNHHHFQGTGWGTVDVDDVMSVLDAALDRYRFCDRDRVGMLGGSYGGYMATWLAGTHSDRFKGICSERAVSNLTALEWNSDIATLFTLEHGVSHLEDPAYYADRSPIRFVQHITTPMLLIHSEEDWRCPISQAEELWVALRLLDKDVDFYRFPGENHDLSRAGSPIQRVQRAEIILDWFADKLDL
ncbi:MAG: S9 family peptidase [Acidimicrobiales bacterium]|nr:S9 family peptidase [Acidimicrobiales bacterium]